MPQTTQSARAQDLDALVALERRVFTTDHISRRSFRALIASPTASLIIAERNDQFAGYALVLFRRGTSVARLYSIAVVPGLAGRGIGIALLAAAEHAARTRRRTAMRLEVEDTNARAIRFYERAGYRRRGRQPSYYEDGTAALRYEKPLR
jgi:ribosomal protein S18 acetylase RimI-like enzyme